jgi:hypothetical protein
MDTSINSERREALATSVSVTADELVIQLADGRTVAVPLAWYPRLLHGTPEERGQWQLSGRGLGIHWPALDEDISLRTCWRGFPLARVRRPCNVGLTLGAGLPNHAMNLTSGAMKAAPPAPHYRVCSQVMEEAAQRIGQQDLALAARLLRRAGSAYALSPRS